MGIWRNFGTFDDYIVFFLLYICGRFCANKLSSIKPFLYSQCELYVHHIIVEFQCISGLQMFTFYNGFSLLNLSQDGFLVLFDQVLF